jgi:hypothetical protein
MPGKYRLKHIVTATLWVALALPLWTLGAPPADKPPNDATLTGYWKLHETSGTSVTDSSGHGFNGVNNGAIINQPGQTGRA